MMCGIVTSRLRSKRGPLSATLILWPVWVFWHLPSFLARPEFELPQFFGFALGILAAAIWLTWIWNATQSVLLAVVWHTTVNIARGIAQAMSMTLFLAMSNAVLSGALIIVVYWLIKRPGPLNNDIDRG